MHRPVSEPLLELRAPLVHHLLQVAEPAPRLVPLTLLLELRGQLVLLDRTPLCLLLAGCWPLVSSRKNISVWDNNSDETKSRRYFFKSLGRRLFFLQNMASEGWVPSF